MEIILLLSAVQGMVHIEDKKHKVDVKHAAVDSLFLVLLALKYIMMWYLYLVI